MDVVKAKPNAIIVDIDGTLLNGGNPIESTVRRVNSYSGTVIIVTGRTDRERAVKDLREAGVKYDSLYADTEGKGSRPHKKSVAENLLRRYNVTQAIENDERARRIYSNLGIKAVAP